MLDKLRFYNFINKINEIMIEPVFKRKLNDLIPDIQSSNVKVNIKSSILHIKRLNDNKVEDNLIIKATKNTIEYYYYSTNNFNECGKLYFTKDNIITKYCHYDISNNYNTQNIKTKTTLSIYNKKLIEIFKYTEDDNENYITIDGIKKYLESNTSKLNRLIIKKQTRAGNKIISIVEKKYYNINMKKNNSTKYFISTDTSMSDRFIPYKYKNKRLSKNRYLKYKNSIS